MEMEFFVPPDEAAALVRVLAAGALGLVHAAGHPARPPAPARARRGRALALLLGHQRRRVPVPDRLAGARGHRQPRRLRPDPARASTPAQRLEWKDPQTRRELRPARDRAGRRRRARGAGVHVRRLRRGRDRRRAAHRAAAASALAPVKVAVLPLLSATGIPRRRARGLRAAARAAWRPSTTRAARSAGATAARTRSARRTR